MSEQQTAQPVDDGHEFIVIIRSLTGLNEIQRNLLLTQFVGQIRYHEKVSQREKKSAKAHSNTVLYGSILVTAAATVNVAGMAQEVVGWIVWALSVSVNVATAKIKADNPNERHRLARATVQRLYSLGRHWFTLWAETKTEKQTDLFEDFMRELERVLTDNDEAEAKLSIGETAKQFFKKITA